MCILFFNGAVGNDPHFFLPLANGENLCFSIQGQPDFMFSLIKDKFVQLNAQFVLPDSDESTTISNVTTFLGNLGLLLRCPTTSVATIIKVTAQDHSIRVGNEYIVIDNRPVTIMISCDASVTVTTSGEVPHKMRQDTAWAYINSDVGFGMKLRFYRKHLDMMITKQNGLTTTADGLMGKFSAVNIIADGLYTLKVLNMYIHHCIGQFMGKHVTIDSDYNVMKIADYKPISVVKGPAWHFLGTDAKCYYGRSTDNQASGVIRGSYMDYVVEELLPSV